MASKTTAVEETEPKTLGDVLDQMKNDMPPIPPMLQAPSLFATPEPKLKVYQSIAMIIEELGKDGISKDSQAKEGGGFKYRGVDQVYAALSPLLHKHGLVILPRYKNRHQTERITKSGTVMYDVVVEADFDFVSTIDGSKHTVSTIGEAFDTGDKATNKSMAVAFKYAAFITFCIPVEGEDNDPDASQGHDMAPGGKAKPAAQQSAPQESDEERRERLRVIAMKHYDDAEAWLRACVNMVDLKRTFEEKINWDMIPKGWHPRLVKIEKEMVEEIKKASAPKPQTTAPDFGKIDDDIPF